MGEQEKMFDGTLYYGEEIDKMQPLGCVVKTDVLLQSEETHQKWDNLCCQTLTISTSISENDKKYIRKLMHNDMPRLPRKLKKYVKKHYIFGDTTVVSRWELLMAFALNNPQKTAWKHHWTIGFVKK